MESVINIHEYNEAVFHAVIIGFVTNRRWATNGNQIYHCCLNYLLVTIPKKQRTWLNKISKHLIANNTQLSCTMAFPKPFTTVPQKLNKIPRRKSTNVFFAAFIWIFSKSKKEQNTHREELRLFASFLVKLYCSRLPRLPYYSAYFFRCFLKLISCFT